VTTNSRIPQSIKIELEPNSRNTDTQSDSYQLNSYYWPGEGDPIVFIHATGYHARCWDQIIKQLPNTPIYAIDVEGHGASGRAKRNPNWEDFADGVIGIIEHLDLKQILVVGHSMGGHVATLAAHHLPYRIKQLLLLDPVIIDPARNRPPIEPEQHPVYKRRNQWANSEELYKSYSTKDSFKGWDNEVLKDYCHHGLVNANNGQMSLACHPHFEATVYCSLSKSSLIYQVMGDIKIPVRIVRAKSRTVDDPPFNFGPSPTWSEAAAQFPNATDRHLKDKDHFFPMKEPQIVVEEIIKLL